MSTLAHLKTDPYTTPIVDWQVFPLSHRYENIRFMMHQLFRIKDEHNDDKYTSPMPSYGFALWGGERHKIYDKVDYEFEILFLKSMESIGVNHVPVLLFTEFIEYYYNAYPEDYPLTIIISMSGKFIRLDDIISNLGFYEWVDKTTS